MIFNVCHYTPLVDRRLFFDEQVSRLSNNVNVNYIEDHDRECLTQQQRDKFMKITDAEISLFLKHLECYKIILEGGTNFGVVMEDDCIFHDDFDQHMNIILRDMPGDFDILYCGVFPFYDRRPNPVPQDLIGESTFYDMTDTTVFRWTGNNKGTDFYIVSKNMCESLLHEFDDEPFVSQPIDHWMGTTCIHKYKTYWYNTEFTTHGSWGDGKGSNITFSNSMKDCRGF